MKIGCKKDITSKVVRHIQKLSGDIVLRSDVACIAASRQISRALGRLVQGGYLVRLGYGVYAKLIHSETTQVTYLKEGVLPTMRTALDRLNIHWELSREEQDYQAGRSTQIRYILAGSA